MRYWMDCERLLVALERETGFEPATPCLEGRHSSTELLPHPIPAILIAHEHAGIRINRRMSYWKESS